MAERDAPAAAQSASARSAALASLGLDAPVSELTRPQVDEWAVRRMWEGIQSIKSPPPGRERPHLTALAAFAAVASVLALALASTQLIASLREPAPKPDVSASSTAALSPAALSPAAHSAALEPAATPSEAARLVEPLLTRDARRFELLEAPPVRPSRAGAASGRPAASASTARVDFADGSSIEASPGARVEALASGPGEFAVAVRRGLAQFRVTPGGPRRWRIDASHAQVEVLGTVLWVESDGNGTSVRVDVGRVLVSSPELPGGSRHVDAGQSLRLGAASPAASESAASAAAAPARPTPRLAHHGAPREQTRHEGEAADARSARARDGALLPPVRSTAGVATAAAALWEGADEARRRGEPARAAALLTQLVEEHPGDSQVALAAFTLGVLQLDHLARPFEASEWFQRALELGLSAALREDAYLRWAEALGRARDRARLAKVSTEYARLYPRGRHGAAIEELARAAGHRAASPVERATSPKPDAAKQRPASGAVAPASQAP